MKSLRRAADWLRDNVMVGVFFCLGGLAALGLRLPLFTYQLPSDLLNVVSAALGAALAVWGAAWVSSRKETQQQLQAYRAIAVTVQPTLQHINKFRDAFGRANELAQRGASRAELKKAIHEAIEVGERIQRMTERLSARIQFMEPLFLQLGGGGVLAHGWLEGAPAKVDYLVRDVRWALYYEDPQVMNADYGTVVRQVAAARTRILYSLRTLKNSALGIELPDDED